VEVRLGLRQGRSSTIPCLAKKDSLNFFGGPARIQPPRGVNYASGNAWKLLPPLFPNSRSSRLTNHDLAVVGRHQEHISLLDSHCPQDLDRDGDSEAVAYFDHFDLELDWHS